MTEKRWPKENPASRSNITVINMSTGCNRIANKSDTNSEPNTFHPLLHLEKCCAHSEANGVCGDVGMWIGRCYLHLPAISSASYPHPPPLSLLLSKRCHLTQPFRHQTRYPLPLFVHVVDQRVGILFVVPAQCGIVSGTYIHIIRLVHRPRTRPNLVKWGLGRFVVMVGGGGEADLGRCMSYVGMFCVKVYLNGPVMPLTMHKKEGTERKICWPCRKGKYA